MEDPSFMFWLPCFHELEEQKYINIQYYIIFNHGFFQKLYKLPSSLPQVATETAGGGGMVCW